MLECQARARELKNRLRNPTNAVHDDGIDLKRKKIRKAAAVVVDPVPIVIESVLPAPDLVHEVEQLQGAADALQRQIEELRAKYNICSPSSISVKFIQIMVAREYGIRVEDMLSERRTANVVRPRHVAIYIAKALTRRSLPDLGLRFGGRDYTTILSAIRRIETIRATDPDMAHMLQKLSTDIVGNATELSPIFTEPVNASQS